MTAGQGGRSFSVSVVVATRMRSQLLRQCLSAVNDVRGAEDEVIVVDNSSGDPATADASATFGARYVVEPRVGLSRARNSGVRHAAKEIVAFLDDDAIPRLGWLASLVRPFEDERVMAVTGQVLPLNVTTAAEVASVESGWIDFGRERRVIDRSDPFWFELACFGGLGIGTNMAFRRLVFDQWSGFRESIGRGTALSGCEEHYAFFELLRLGHRVVYEPDAQVAHPHPDTHAALVALRRRNVREAFAYATLLLVEEPGFRLRTLRYLARRAAGGGQPWEPNTSFAQRQRLLAPREHVLAALQGPSLYLRSRRLRKATTPGP